MPPIAERFRKRTNELLVKVTHIDGIEHSVRIDFAPFCTMKYINDDWYVQGENILKTERLKKLREDEVQFCESASTIS